MYFQAGNNGTDKEVKAYKLDEDAFLRELKTIAVGADPSTEVVEQFHYKHATISAADLLEKARA